MNDWPAAVWAVRDRAAALEALIVQQGGRCSICDGALPTDGNGVELDHGWPKSRGGGNEIENLYAVHSYCNAIKGNRILFPAPRTNLRAIKKRLGTPKGPELRKLAQSLHELAIEVTAQDDRDVKHLDNLTQALQAAWDASPSDPSARAEVLRLADEFMLFQQGVAVRSDRHVRDLQGIAEHLERLVSEFVGQRDEERLYLTDAIAARMANALRSLVAADEEAAEETSDFLERRVEGVTRVQQVVEKLKAEPTLREVEPADVAAIERSKSRRNFWVTWGTFGALAAVTIAVQWCGQVA